MITPQFEVSQDDDFVYVEIRAPYVKASMIQFEAAGDLFVFSLPPYYLRLRLPGSIIEDERMSSHYDIATSKVYCKVAKLHPSERFADLDMLSKLLATKQQQSAAMPAKPMIQEVGTPEPESNGNADEFDWEMEQQLPEDSTSTVTYGFNNQYSERIGLSLHSGNEINELAEPERETSSQRLELLRATTIDQFDAEYYLADLYDDSTIQELLRFESPSLLTLDAAHKDRLLKLGYREFILTDPKATYIGIIPLLFGWAYDFRTNMGDATVESSWTVGKLAPCMCFLYNSYQSIAPVVYDCSARALVKPLYRHWGLTLQVWEDVLKVLRGGKKAVLAVFVHLLQIFETELHLCYRQILIEDYTIWIQSASEKVVASLANELTKCLETLEKSSLYLPISQAESGEASNDVSDPPKSNDVGPDSDDESDVTSDSGSFAHMSAA